MGVSKRVFCSLGVQCKGTAGLRLTAGNHVPVPRSISWPCARWDSAYVWRHLPVLTWAEVISWEAPGDP